MSFGQTLFYVLLKEKLAPQGSKYISSLLAGAAIGLAASVDNAGLLFVAGFGAYILLTKQLRRTFPVYAVAAGLVMLPGILISHAITGDFRPIAGHAEYFHYPGSYWNGGADHLSGMERNSFPNRPSSLISLLFI